MVKQIKFACTVGICLIALVHCVPIEVVYNSEGCDCPTKLNYQVNMPRVPVRKHYTHHNYGYRVDMPTTQPNQAKLRYNFDFIVERPRVPVQPYSRKLNLYAKVDRIVVNKEDCASNYESEAPCNCGQCGITKPQYKFDRYVYKKIELCRCQKPNCKCNQKRLHMPNSIDWERKVTMASPENIRRKRDLDFYRAFFRPRKTEPERQGRFVKIYHKNLTGKRHAMFGVETSPEPATPISKFKPKAFLFPNLRSRLVKRDIKGEYDLLEKENEQMDLTLPEIIQFMPETLQSNFKRGRCQFGCTADRTDSKENAQKAVDGKEMEERLKAEKMKHQASTEVRDGKSEMENPEQNIITSTYTKRNAATYNYANQTPPRFRPQQLPPSIAQQSAYPAPPLLSSIPANPYQQQRAQQQRPPPQNAYAAHAQYINEDLERDDNLRLSAIHAANSGLGAFNYAGDLDSSVEEAPSEQARSYPVQYLSNADLDKIITDIVFRHPDFVEASTHYGGTLVDPEPLQEQETKDLLKKLLDGRLKLWFGDDDDNFGQQQYPVYGDIYDRPPSPLAAKFLPTIV